MKLNNERATQGVYRGDEELWSKYWAAVSAKNKKAKAAAIVEHHINFIKSYARKYSFKKWSAEVKHNYYLSLIEIALKKVATWLPSFGASFITYLSISFKAAKWSELDLDNYLHIPREAKQILALAEMCINEIDAFEQRTPSYEEITEYVNSKFSGRKQTVAKIVSLLNIPKNVELSLVVEETTTADSSLDPSDIYEEKEFKKEVVDILSNLKLTKFEKSIIKDIYMADKDKTAKFADLAKKHKVHLKDAKLVESHLKSKLATALEPTR